MTEKGKTWLPWWARASKRGDREGPIIRKRSERLGGRLSPDRMKWIVLPVLSLAVSLLLFPNILKNPRVYRDGDVAERDIKASHDFLVENKSLTEKEREKAVRSVLSVYDFDGSSSKTVSLIKEAFRLGREYAASPPPLDGAAGEAAEETAPGGRDRFLEVFFDTLGVPPDETVFDKLAVTGFPEPLEQGVIDLIHPILDSGVVGNEALFANQAEKGGIILHEIETKQEITATDLERFYDVEGARGFIASRQESLAASLGAPETAEAAVLLAQALVRPNLTLNQRETEARRDAARKSIKPAYFKVKKGEMLVREGERINAEHLLKLSEAVKRRSSVDMVSRVPAMAVLLGTLFSVIFLVGLGGSRSFVGDGRAFLFHALTLLGLFVFAWTYQLVAEEIARGFPYLASRDLLFAMPLAFGAMLIAIFQGMGMAVGFSLVISVLTSLLTTQRVELFIYFLVGSLVGAYGVRECNERGILIKAGLRVALVNILLGLSIRTIHGSFYSMETVVAGLAGFAGGILAGVIATGILPLIEMSFGFTTDIKLLELASLDQPLLRDLMVQAPGTYHHSVIISNMVEATAKAVLANPLLAKVSAYYHDIGKMKKPLYFIENQMGAENRHEKLAPSMSSLILISHVKDGVELARERKLGREIIDIIQQHHGTSLISFFYQKAKDRMGAKGGKSTEIKEEDFRYPGPRPQTKEAGLVMLADMVEAATRSIPEPTPARIQGTVQKIINKAFSDGQLDECELTLKDLHMIAKSFNKTLNGIFHHRIEYPEVVAKTARKEANGSPDQLATEDPGAKRTEDKAAVEEGLRRLGLS